MWPLLFLCVGRLCFYFSYKLGLHNNLKWHPCFYYKEE